MALYEWQRGAFTLKDLEGKLKTMSKTVAKTKPMSREEYNKKRQNIQRDINNKKLEAAQISCQIEQLRIRKEDLQKIVEERTTVSKGHQEVLKSRRDALKDAQQAKNQVYSGGKISNPTSKMEQVRADIQALRNTLQFGTISSAEERRTIRDIAAKEEELGHIKDYIESNADSLWSTCDAARDETRVVEAEYKKAQQDTGMAVKNRNDCRDQIKELDTTQKELSVTIGELSEEKVRLDEKFREDVRKYERLTKEKRALEIEISARKSDVIRMRATEKEVKEEKKRRMKEENEKQEKQAQAQAEKEREEAEKMERTKARRAKAMAAYAAMQQKVKAKSVKPVAKTSSASAPPAKLENDPHQAEKALCQSLIVLCESKRPTGRRAKKKKKGVRLSYRADYFAKFNQVAVKIPKYSSELDSTIEALRQKIRSYDEEPEEILEEPTPETQEVVQEEASEEPQVQAEEPELVPADESQI